MIYYQTEVFSLFFAVTIRIYPNNIGFQFLFSITQQLKQMVYYQIICRNIFLNCFLQLFKLFKMIQQQFIYLIESIETINIILICISSIMRKLLLSVKIIVLSIVIIQPNLIRFGDFQNLVTPIYPRTYAHCNTTCNGTWFASIGVVQIGKSRYTATVDMNNGENYQLCQNISSMDIQKIYIFTFDMLCNSNHQDCSMWVIINKQVVNGSKHTSYDHFSHKIEGYFIPKLSKNQICFKSCQNPSVKYSGARIDNITLDFFNASVPCNVSGCELCVLNFPNSCQVCQTGYVKQMNQTCTLCSTIISNCARCQRINTLYTCVQCSSQFLLNNQRNFCYHNSVIFFAFQFSETTSIDNIFIIKTNVSIALLIQAGFSIQNLPSISIQINSSKQQNLALTINKKGFLEIKVNLTDQYQNFTINFQIEQGFIQINNTYFSIETSFNKKPLVFLSETQITIFKKYDEAAKPIIQNLDAIFSIIKSSGFGFFVTNIFNYLSLMTFYEYLNTFQPKTFRLFIENLSSNLNSFSFYSFINLQTQAYEICEYQVVEKIKTSRQEWSGPLQDGFSTNFYKNNLQPFTMIAAFAIRLILCWLLHKIFNVSFLQSSHSQNFISICQQFQTIIPIIILPCFNLIIQSITSKDYVESINTILHIILMFICLLTPFVHLLTSLYQIQRTISKDRRKLYKERKKLQLQIKKNKKRGINENLRLLIEPVQAISQQILKDFDQKKKQLNSEQKNRIVQAKFKLVQRLKLLSIPILVCFQQVLPFILINLCLLLIIFVLSLKLRKYFSIYQFAFNTIISLAWLLLHCSFCVYFIIQKWFFDQWSVSTAIQISKYVSYCSIAIILSGAVVQILDCLIGIIITFKQIFTYLYRKFKKSFKITLQDQKKSQNKTQNTKQTTKSKQPNAKIKSKTAKKMDTQNINSVQNCSKSIRNRYLFNFNQPQGYQKNKRIPKPKNQTQVNRKLFYFDQCQSFSQKKAVSLLKNQIQVIQKIKKTKQQGKNYQLKVKFRNQN